MKKSIAIFTNSGNVLEFPAKPSGINRNKYNYLAVIQQHYGQGWEDVSEYETNSQYIAKEMNDKPGPNGKPETFLKHDRREYELLGYPTRVINRKTLNQ